MIFVDCLRADHLGCYGYQRATSPNLDALAREGTTFESFYASAIPTQPSFTTSYTGQHALTHGIVAHKGDRELPPEAPWLPTLLRDLGQTTADFCCLPRYKHWFLRGFEFVVDSTSRYQDYGYTAEVLNSRAIPWLQQHKDEPFFMSVHYWDPHTPYLPPEQYRVFYEGDPTDPALPNTLEPLERQYFSVMWKKWFSKLPKGLRDAEYLVSLYDGEVLHADTGVGALLNALEESGHAEDTLVLLTSDHGELFYRHDIFCDHHGLYDGNLHCPLLVRWPGVTQPGSRVEQFASHEDLAPTLLSAMGQTPPEAMDGLDLTPLLSGQSMATRDAVISLECTWQSKWSIRTRDAKLIVSRRPDYHGMPTRELFDLREDPDELHNLAEERPSQADELEARLDRWISEGMARNGLTVDPLLDQDVTLGKQWENWLRANPPG